LRDPREIVRKIRAFRADCKAHPRISDAVLSARRFTRWMVDVSGTTVHVAPVRYAMFSNVTVSLLQNAEKGDTDSVGLTEESRIEEIGGDSKLYERACRAIRKLTGRDDEVTIFVPQQRYLYSDDAVEPPKTWSSWGLQPTQQRESSIDAAVIEETRLRFSAGAVRVMEAIVAQHGDKNLFSRNRHLALGFNPNPQDPTPRYVFIPRDLNYANLHELVRGVIGEALDYRFRYRNVAPLTFVVAFSRAIIHANDEAIAMLNHYKILVVHYDDEEERYRLRGRCQSRNAGEDLHWLRVAKHHVIISEAPSFGDVRKKRAAKRSPA